MNTTWKTQKKEIAQELALRFTPDVLNLLITLAFRDAHRSSGRIADDLMERMIFTFRDKSWPEIEVAVKNEERNAAYFHRGESSRQPLGEIESWLRGELAGHYSAARWGILEQIEEMLKMRRNPDTLHQAKALYGELIGRKIETGGIIIVARLANQLSKKNKKATARAV